MGYRIITKAISVLETLEEMTIIRTEAGQLSSMLGIVSSVTEPEMVRAFKTSFEGEDKDVGSVAVGIIANLKDDKPWDEVATEVRGAVNNFLLMEEAKKAKRKSDDEGGEEQPDLKAFKADASSSSSSSLLKEERIVEIATAAALQAFAATIPQSVSGGRGRGEWHNGRGGGGGLYNDGVCHHWKRGSCGRGSTCRFLHPTQGQQGQNAFGNNGAAGGGVVQAPGTPVNNNGGGRGRGFGRGRGGGGGRGGPGRGSGAAAGGRG
jgi:hypothetical protein